MRSWARTTAVLGLAALLAWPVSAHADDGTGQPPPGEAAPAPVEPSIEPSATPPARPRLPLRFDDRGPLVAQAQERLVWLGYELSTTSQAKDLFGITMRRAVKAFQAKHWLEPTGVVDRRTWRTLERVAGDVGRLPRRCTEVDKAVCIDKTARVLRLVVDGRVRMTADARFGGPGMETGEGTFHVASKSYDHVSSRYGSWMPRAMFFNGDEAVHYSPDFAQVGYSRGSHGCVGLRDMEKATWLYERVPVGTRVVVYWS